MRGLTEGLVVRGRRVTSAGHEGHTHKKAIRLVGLENKRMTANTAVTGGKAAGSGRQTSNCGRGAALTLSVILATSAQQPLVPTAPASDVPVGW